MKFLKRLLKGSKKQTSKSSPKLKPPVVVAAIAGPRPARDNTKAIIQKYRELLKAKNQRELHKVGHELAEKASTADATSERVATLLSRGRQWNLILSYLDRVGPLWLENAKLLLKAGQAERHLRNPVKAVEFLERGLLKGPDDHTLAELRIQLGLALHDSGRFGPAVEVFKEAVADPLALRISAPLQRALSETSAVHTKKVLEDACASDPTNDFLVLALGEFHRAVLDYEGAFHLFEGALNRDPENSEFAIGLMKAALALSSDEHLIEAIDVGERFFFKTRRKDFAGALVSAYLRAPSSDAAENGLDDVYFAFNSDPALLAVVSEGYLRNANIAKAEIALTKALELDPNNTGIVYRLSGVLAQQSKTGEAIANLLRNVPDMRRDANFYAKLGHLRAWSGDHLSAVADLRAALALDGQHSSALADLAHCYDIMGDISVAAHTMQAAMVAAVTRPLPKTPGFAELNFKRIRRRLLRLAYVSDNEGLASVLTRDIRREEALSMRYDINNWEGQPLDEQQVMCITQSGIGDEMRYTAAFRHMLGKTKSASITCDPRMLSLLTRSFPDFKFYPVQRNFPRLKKPRLDVRSSLIPRSMRDHVSDEVALNGEGMDVWALTHDLYETAFFGGKYQPVAQSLVPRDDLRLAFKKELSAKANGRPVIGLSWRGGHNGYHRDASYFKIEDWSAILDNPDYCFTNLQYSVDQAEIDYLRAKLGDRFIEFPELDLMDDIEGIAALCSELDCVIGVCTAVLELAAAVGAKVLFMMRSSHAIQSIKLAGYADKNGTYGDKVWQTCRTIPKRSGTDEEMVEKAQKYLRSLLGPNSDHGANGGRAEDVSRAS